MIGSLLICKIVQLFLIMPCVIINAFQNDMKETPNIIAEYSTSLFHKLYD